MSLPKITSDTLSKDVFFSEQLHASSRRTSIHGDITSEKYPRYRVGLSDCNFPMYMVSLAPQYTSGRPASIVFAASKSEMVALSA